MTKIACITTLTAAPGKRDELLEYCKAEARRFVEREPGTLRIELLIPPSDPDKIVVWDVYQDLAAVDAHRNGELLRKFSEGANGLLVGMSGIRHTMVE